MNQFWFKTNFKKQKSNSEFSNSFFYFKSKNEFQKALSFFNFCYEIEIRKMFQNSFCFEIRKRIILLAHQLFSLFFHFCFCFCFHFCFCFCFHSVFLFLFLFRFCFCFSFIFLFFILKFYYCTSRPPY